MSAHIAAGVVVSRSSPGMALFNSGSFLSSLVISSPTLRTKLVSPTGPPILSNRRLPAVITLFDCRRAQSAERHTAVVEMGFCDRRIFQDVFRVITYESVQLVLFFIDAL